MGGGPRPQPRTAAPAGEEFFRGVIHARGVEARPPNGRRSVRGSGLTEDDLLSALVENAPTELGQQLVTMVDGREVVTGERPRLAGEAGRAVRKEDLRLADPAGVEQQLTRRRVAGVVLQAKPGPEVAQRHPRTFTT